MPAAFGDTRLPARFWDKVEVLSNGCWRWTGALKGTGGGYAAFHWEGKVRYGHRLAFELLVGPVSSGSELDHLCRLRCCVNPLHLQPVTRQVNVLRGNSPAAGHARKTHCPNGHPYSAENTYIRKDNQARQCRRCAADRAARNYERKRNDGQGVRNL